MKYSLILGSAIIAFTIVSCKNQEENKKGVGVVLSDLDTTINPVSDFFHYANGGWLKANKIPDDQSRWGSFNILIEENEKHMRELAEVAAANKSAVKGSPEQLVGDFYHSFLKICHRGL